MLFGDLSQQRFWVIVPVHSMHVVPLCSPAAPSPGHLLKSPADTFSPPEASETMNEGYMLDSKACQCA